MTPSEIKVGDVLVWPVAEQFRYRVIASEQQDESIMEPAFTTIRCERAGYREDNVTFHFPTGVEMADWNQGGPMVFESDGCRCESCEQFLCDELDPGTEDPVSQGMFCSACTTGVRF